MIARMWHGVTAASDSDAYAKYLEETGVPEYRRTEGNRGVYVLRRAESGRAHFLLISLWESAEAIRRYAGPDTDRAVYHPRDKEFLLELDPNVTHYEVLRAPESGPRAFKAAGRPSRSRAASRRGSSSSRR